MTSDEFRRRARVKTRRAKSRLAVIFSVACSVRLLRVPAVRVICMIEGGQMWSRTFRELMAEHCGVEIGDYSYGPCLWPGGLPHGTRVGNYCSLADEITVFRRNHPTERRSQHPFFFNRALGLLSHDSIPGEADNPLVIGHDVWIGHGVTVTPGCKRIGDGAIVAAKALLSSDVPPLAVVGGVPARVIRWRFAPSVQRAWLQSRWWLESIESLAPRVDSFLAPLETETSLEHMD
jgi:virginiamycin A acetyltransferase